MPKTELSMKKILITATLLLITTLFVGGIYYQDNPLMWLASTTNEFAYLRGAIIFTLVVLVISNPPRGLFFRASMMTLSAFIGVVVFTQLDQYQIQIVDAIVMCEVAILLAIEGLELSEEKSVAPAHRSIRASNTK